MPFTVITFGWATCLPTGEGTTGQQLKTQSKRWKSREADIEEAVLASNGPLRSEHKRGPSWMSDTPIGASHFVIVDGVSKGKIDESALLSFKNAFVARLSEELPSIAVSTLSIMDDSPCNDRLAFLADYAGRGLPLLLIDSRPSPEGGYPAQIKEAAEYMDDIEVSLQKAGTRNLYWTSTLA